LRPFSSYRVLEQEYLPIVLLKEYAYCPRFAYFALFLNRNYVTESMHYALEAKASLENLLRDYERAGWRVYREVKVFCKRLKIQGKCDAVLVKDQKLAVVEAKTLTELSKRNLFGRKRHVLAQLVAYGIAAEDTFMRPLSSLIAVGVSRVVEVKVTPALRMYVEQLARRLWKLYLEEEIPLATKSGKCYYCKFRGVCANFIA